MYKYGKKSRARLDTCVQPMRLVMDAAIEVMDIKILDGNRDQERQDEAFESGHSKKKFPGSKHNKKPSPALDAAPYPIDWEDRERFTFMAGVIIGIGHTMGITIRWGGDWDRDRDMKDNNFDDLVHFEIVDG